MITINWAALPPIAMVVCVGVSIYILFRTRWMDEPAGRKREAKKR